MKALGLKSLVRMKKYRSYKGKVGKTAPNILERDFKADKPNEKWATDITEFKLFGKKLYLSPMLDLFNGEIITYTIGSRPTYSLVSEMLENSFKRLSEDDKLLIHSDQGWHYQMKQYRIAPLEFAMEVLKKLDGFAPDTLHSWYNLNKTHKPEYFFQLMNSINK